MAPGQARPSTRCCCRSRPKQVWQVALIVVLIRAGLSLELGTLRRVGRPALLLCFLPSTAEIIAITLLVSVLLGIPVIQAAVLGAVLAAVSPAVVVPRMLQLAEQRYARGSGAADGHDRCGGGRCVCCGAVYRIAAHGAGGQLCAA